MAGLDAQGDTDLGDLERGRRARSCWWSARRDRGLSRLVAQRCDVLVRIPVAAQTESLNAGVAAGIALYEVATRRAR